MTGHARYALIGNLVALAALIGLCLWLVPLYGAVGAAISQSLALSLQMLTYTFFVKRHLGFTPFNIFSRV